MRRLILLLVLIVVVVFSINAQDFKNFDLNTEYDDFIYDVIELDSTYILCASQETFDTSTHFYSMRSVFYRLSLDGNIIDSLVADTFGTNTLNVHMFIKDSFIYILSVANI